MYAESCELEYCHSLQAAKLHGVRIMHELLGLLPCRVDALSSWRPSRNASQAALPSLLFSAAATACTILHVSTMIYRQRFKFKVVLGQTWKAASLLQQGMAISSHVR